jgi:hypothetical protein
MLARDGGRHILRLGSCCGLVIARISAGSKSMLAAATFCSTCSGEPEPGIGRMRHGAVNRQDLVLEPDEGLILRLSEGGEGRS